MPGLSKSLTGVVLAGFLTGFLPAQQRAAPDLEENVKRLEQRVRDLEEMVRLLQDRHERKSVQDAAAPRLETATAAESSAAAPPSPSAPPGTLRAYWKDGLRLDSADEAFQLKLGGRIHLDWGFYSADSRLENHVGPLLDGVEFRRTRFVASGTIHDNVEYKAEFDFAGGDAEFKDVFMGVDLPVVGGVKFGHHKEPFSLEELTSSNYATFLERSVANAFSPSRNTGVSVQRTAASDRVNLAAGVFRDAGDTGFAKGDGGYNLTARFTGLPWYEEEGRKLLHLGVAYSRQNSTSPALRYRERPESHLSPRFVDTGVLAARSLDLLGLEAALVHGPFSLQGEYNQSFVNAVSGADPRFKGFYLQGSFFATGESRSYRTSSASFDRTGPHRVFGEKDGGAGAWEIAARYSQLDLNSGSVQGGRLSDFTLGLNWYLNPNARVMWNYVFSDLDSIGQANIFQTRFQVDF